jgi:hypothetical protein
MSNPQQLVQKLWNYCNILRDDGLSYGDYVEQFTYLLFLKMAEEQSSLRGRPSAVPSEYSWPGLLAKDDEPATRRCGRRFCRRRLAAVSFQMFLKNSRFLVWEIYIIRENLL